MISHTHWDREWYLTREKTRLLLVDMMDELLAIMAEQEEFVFMLDGQTILLEDYLEVRPDRAEELAHYIREGRISVGPWYVMPDEFLISGESHIRNYLLGSRLSLELGGLMRMGYLPDSFGHPSQMPQILSRLGMNEALFWRGLGPDVDRTEFIWEGRDGTELLAVNMPFSYGVAACLPDDPQAFIERLRLKIGLLAPLSSTNVLLLMNGVDHVAPQRALLANLGRAREEIGETELLHARLEDYFEELRRAPRPRQRTVGELRSGYRSYLLGGTISTRIYLKQANFRAESLIERYGEAMSTISTALFASPYPEHRLRHAWKALMANLPHDSICGCGIDEIHEEMMVRYRAIEEIGQDLIDKAVEGLRARVDPSDPRFDGCLAVFNPALHERSDLVKASLITHQRLERKVNYETGELQEYPVPPIERQPTGVALIGPDGREVEARILEISEPQVMRLDLHTQPEMYRVSRVDLSFVAQDLPGLGHALYNYRLIYDGPAVSVEGRPTTKGGVREQGAAETGERGTARIENEHFLVVYDWRNACLRVFDKESGRWYEGLNRFEDTGDAGDEYTFSAPAEDRSCTLSPDTVETEVGGTADYPELLLRGRLAVPARLSPDRRKRSEELADIDIETRISLAPRLARIDIQTAIGNTAEDHRLRVLFPLESDSVDAFSESIFSIEERRIEGLDPAVLSDFVELPSTFPQKSFTSLTGSSGGLTVAVRGLPECEIVAVEGGSAIAVTLLRAVGWLSRSDLRSRKGNGGWPLPTPGAQCKGRHLFEYAILPHGGDESLAAVAARARDFAYPPLAVKLADAGCGGVAAGVAVDPAAVITADTAAAKRRFSAVSCDRAEVVFSAFKRSEERDSLILRCWNSTGEATDATLRFGFDVKGAYEVSLSEERERSVPVEEDQCSIHLGPWRILSLELAT